MQSYRIYFTVAGGNMRPLFVGSKIQGISKGDNEEDNRFVGIGIIG
ncbi:MAG: hypothetical protein PHC29_05075 [Candidatus Omnitrophica bacterium]|nr:hypothetical protein [Candidatus Omnitrophota bacterium]